MQTKTKAYIRGGRPQVPVGQEGIELVEPELKNEENTLLGFLALHLGQLSFDPSSPIC